MVQTLRGDNKSERHTFFGYIYIYNVYMIIYTCSRNADYLIFKWDLIVINALKIKLIHITGLTVFVCVSLSCVNVAN